MQYLFQFLPDVFAAATFLFMRFGAKPTGCETLVRLLVDDCIDEFQLPVVEAAARSGLVASGSVRCTLSRLNEAVRVSSVVALAGALALGSEPGLGALGVTLGVFWLLLFIFTWQRAIRWQSPARSLPDKEQVRKEKVFLHILFFLYIGLSVVAKLINILL